MLFRSLAPTSISYFGRERGGAYAATANTQMSPTAIGPGGGGQPHSNSMPSLAMNYSISLVGVFPTQ